MAVDWLAAWGVRFNSTRLQRYQRLAEKLAASSRTEWQELAKRDPATLYGTYLELDELSKVFRALSPTSNYGLAVARRNKQISAGPDTHAKEKLGNASSRSRDFFFELSVAAFLVRVGFRLDPLAAPDVLARGAGKTLVVECKRPQTFKAITRNAADAFEQLEREYNARPRPRWRGMIALDCTKMVNPTLQPREYASTAEFASVSDRESLEVLEKVKALIRWPRFRNTIGLLVRTRDIGVIPSGYGPEPFVSDAMSVVSAPDVSVADESLLMGMTTGFRSH